MKSRDETEDASRAGWPKTPLTAILRAQTEDPGRRKQALQVVSEQYWRPVKAYLRDRYHDDNLAMDLTQDFFCELVLEKHLLRKYDQERGRFRTFLRTVVGHYADQYDRGRKAKKRAPTEQAVSLERSEGQLAIPSGQTPDESFDRTWAVFVVQETSRKVKESLLRDGLDMCWEIFRARVVDPKLHGAEAVPLKDLCRKYGLDKGHKVTRIVERATKRFKEALRLVVGEYVGSDEEIDDEIRELKRILSK